MNTSAKNQPPMTAAATPAAASRIPGLDGLRAIAVLSVMAFHFTPGWAIGGYLGVDIFFVISGFLITALLLRERAASGTFSFPGFWLRRARRLLPALAAVVLASCAAAALIGGDVLVGLAGQVLGAATFSSNWLFIAEGATYFDESMPELLRNLWSLAVEEQFYLVWPLALLVLLMVPTRWARVVVLVGLAVASAFAMAALFTPGTDATRVYFGTDTHSFGLMIGGALAIASERWSPNLLLWPRRLRQLLPIAGGISVAGLIGLAAWMSADAPFAYQGGLAAVALLAALAIMGSIPPGSWLGVALDARVLRWIGERSYGLYLWHWPVVILLGYALPASTAEAAGGWSTTLLATLVTVLAAMVSYRYVEQPVRRHGFCGSLKRLVVPWQRGRFAVAGASVSVVLLIGSGAMTAFALASDPGASELEVQLAAGRAAVREAAHEESEPPPADQPPPLPSGEQMIAIGDSVMLAAAPAVQAAFPGITIDAAVSRHMITAPGLVQAAVDAGAMRPILLLGLGTNGPIEVETLQRVKDIVGPDTYIVLVNGQAPRDWIPEVNAILARLAQQHRMVELANWHGAIQPRLDVLSRDGVHPGGPIGNEIYVGALRDALQRLAELPPLIDEDDHAANRRV